MLPILKGKNVTENSLAVPYFYFYNYNTVPRSRCGVLEVPTKSEWAPTPETLSPSCNAARNRKPRSRRMCHIPTLSRSANSAAGAKIPIVSGNNESQTRTSPSGPGARGARRITWAAKTREEIIVSSKQETPNGRQTLYTQARVRGDRRDMAI